ncbi:MAG: GspMb/PilO family protein [Acidobacteria bacterium]|nr:GspMb/PilO family protein [Acidobacteriota bacterium]
MSHWIVRVLREKRAVVLPLAVLMLLNVGIGALVVWPMAGRVTQAEQQEQAAVQELVSAQRELKAAGDTLRDKTRAESDLKKFYTEVLPAGMAGARRATYVHLAALAKGAELQYQRRMEEPREPRQGDASNISTLTRFDISMVLKGHYESVRQFIRDIEASTAFIVIDNVALAEGQDAESPLVLTVELSTYYRTVARGD